MPTMYERLVDIQQDPEFPPLSQPQRARLGKKVWLGIKPFITPYFPLEKVKSEEPEGVYTVLRYPPELSLTIDAIIRDFYEQPIRKRKRKAVPIKPAYSHKLKN
jgi:hypothetical protein